ncbi:MAG: IclR family transcriptional regulator C-terminal domain-containing protein [Pseudomonadota bacterium]
MTQKALNKADWIAGLDRGLAILEKFDKDHPRMTATEVGRRVGITRTAARRYLCTLEHLGYLYSDGKRFGLTPRVLRVGWSYFDSAELPRVLRPFLERASVALNEFVYVSVMDGWELVFIARNGSNRVMATGYVLGARAPAQLASPGIMMLAFEPQETVQAWLEESRLVPFTPYTIIDSAKLYAEIEAARAQGYAVIEQQLQIGVRGIAVPLKNRHGETVAALSVSTPIGNESRAQALARVLPTLQDTANALISHL